MLTVVFQGAESRTHRDTLESVKELFDEPPKGVSVGISWKSLRARRLGTAYVEDTAERFPVVLEAGVASTSMTRDEALKAAEEYYEFLNSTSGIVSAIEFHHPSMPDHQAPKDLSPNIIPVWDGHDPKGLDEILSEVGSVATAHLPEGDMRVPAILRRYKGGGTLMVMGQPDLKQAHQHGFNAVLLGSWLHPGKYGEISLWDGAKFHRANGTKKKSMLGRYSDAIQRSGLDSGLLMANDSRELNRLAAYSFISWAASMDLSPDKSDEDEPGEVVPLRLASTSTLPKGVKKVRETRALPIFSQEETETLEESSDGTATIQKRPHLRPSSETVRVCDSCFLSSTCPAYEAASSCAFNFPVEVRTDSQVKALLNSVMELQATRVAFARFAEEVNGGYPDAVVGQEMDRLFRMAEKMKKVEEKRERLTVSVESESSGGGTGVLSRIFGEKAQVEPPPPPPAIEADIVVAEVIESD
jgi:hypothetical protein